MRTFNTGNLLNNIPPVIKNLMIINFLLYLTTFVFKNMGLDLTRWLGLYLPMSPNYEPYQIITHMFMHSQSSFNHILLNMLALFFFGINIERRWGSKKFLFYYISTGLGAALLHWLAVYVEYLWIVPEGISVYDLEKVINEGAQILHENKNYVNPILSNLNLLVNAPIIGASGAVYGIMLAFAKLYPEEYIYMYFVLPIKVKYFIFIMIALEMLQGFFINSSSVAHFAHLGGMLFGYLIIKQWEKNDRI